METAATNVVEAILTAILQWRVAWLDEQKKNAQPPPICRTAPKRLKIIYDNYKDYESTFVPLLMHEIWAQIFEEWTKLETELNGGSSSPMEIDDTVPTSSSSSASGTGVTNGFKKDLNRFTPQVSAKQFWIGVVDYRSEGQYQCLIRCQYLVESHKVNNHLRLIGEGDLIRIDLAASSESQSAPQFNDYVVDPIKKESLLSLFAYVVDVSTERVTPYTTLAECFTTRPCRNYHVVNYQVVIARRPLKLKLSVPMKMSGLYYLKPMIRQIESVALLKESALANDILSPKVITCQLSVPTIVDIKSPHYNNMQYRAIIGTSEALVRNIPKIQLIQGPPGTGKTHTLIGLIKHFYSNWHDPAKMPKVLICAPSNGAIDEVVRRLYKEREFLKGTQAKRSLRMVRVGHPDQISESVRHISLDELVETNANFKIEGLKKKHLSRIKELETELSRCDTEISNLRYSKRQHEIPSVELQIAKLLKELDACKATEEVSTKREVSDASKRNMRFELVKNADVILTTLNSCQRQPLDALFKPERSEVAFHCVIVDEASQCCEPELLMPLCYRISKMILIGDPMQLPATVISRHAQEFDFGRSLFERFFIHFGRYSPTSPIAMLTEQYRMHPDICHFPSKQFYDGRLVSARVTKNPHPLMPYIIFDLKHSAESKSDKTSIENEVEANFVRNLLVAVLTKAPESSKIGVITPYKGQKRLITQKITSLQTQRNIKVEVNTCDGFQGQEKDIIILSCVRASDKGSIGFLKSYQRINVALTRARYSLIVCISAKSLVKDKTWQALMDDAKERRFVNILTKTPSCNALVDMITAKPVQGNDTKASKLLRSNAAGFNQGIYEPEFIIPMDID